MNHNEEIKIIVQEKYGEIVQSTTQEGCSCCGDGQDFIPMNDDYTGHIGYVPEADLQLGCGMPVEMAELKEGQTILDLGSGAGNDLFIARQIVGDNGYLIGVDMTEPMIKKANENKNKLGFENIDFRLGDIESLPVENDSVHVVISNCVLNLVPDKEKAFAEVFRVLKPGANFCISDIVSEKTIPDSIKKSTELYTGCISGAQMEDQYLDIIKSQGFVDIEIRKSKAIPLPKDILNENEDPKMKSVTVFARKPE